MLRFLVTHSLTGPVNTGLPKGYQIVQNGLNPNQLRVQAVYRLVFIEILPPDQLSVKIKKYVSPTFGETKNYQTSGKAVWL